MNNNLEKEILIPNFCNGYSSSSPPASRVFFGPLRIAVSLTVLLERGFHALIRNVLFSSPTDMGSHNLHPLGGPMSSLAHRSVSRSSTICNNSSPPLTDIVRFGPLRIVISLTIINRIC